MLEIKPGIYMIGPIPPGTRLILAAENLLDFFAPRSEDGRKITAEWGDQTPEGWYVPQFKVTDDGKVLVDRVEQDAALDAQASLEMERDWRETLQIAIEKTLTHPSIRAKIRRRLEFALNDNERVP